MHNEEYIADEDKSLYFDPELDNIYYTSGLYGCLIEEKNIAQFLIGFRPEDVAQSHNKRMQP